MPRSDLGEFKGRTLISPRYTDEMSVLRTLLRAWRKKRFLYDHLAEVQVDKSALLHNLKTFQGLGTAVAPVLKSNAYGHGLLEVAQLMETAHLPFLCVDSYYEALILRNEGIRTPILIIGYTPARTALRRRLRDVSFGIIGLEELRTLSSGAKRPISIHLKIDTGMHRHGIPIDEIEEAYVLIRANKHIALEGIYSHFADADTTNSLPARAQITTWNETVQQIRKEFSDIRYYHIAATSGSFYLKEIEANVMRLGIGLYGMNASLANLDLRPALELVTRITSLRTVEKGKNVGYNATFTALQRMRIATIPLGYYEGVDRRLSNKGSVLVDSTPCPIVGRVSMNITSFDVSHLPSASVGDLVTVISKNANDPSSVENIARACDTIPYEILVKIPAHLRRVVI